MADGEYVQVELNALRAKVCLLNQTYDGSTEANGDPTLEELEIFIREEAFAGLFCGCRIKVKLGNKVLRGQRRTLTQLGVPRRGAVLHVTEVFC